MLVPMETSRNEARPARLGSTAKELVERVGVEPTTN